jgi:hypothetical protein
VDRSGLDAFLVPAFAFSLAADDLANVTSYAACFNIHCKKESVKKSSTASFPVTNVLFDVRRYSNVGSTSNTIERLLL